MKKSIAIFCILSLSQWSCGQKSPNSTDPIAIGLIQKRIEMSEKTDGEWRNKLTPEQYRVLREKGTERPFSGQFNDHDEKGVYTCAGCGHELFRSDDKFDAHCGWPSFSKPENNDNIVAHEDNTLGMSRTEIICANCGGHLGHVFNDGPAPTGLRYCINSVSLGFSPTDAPKPDK